MNDDEIKKVLTKLIKRQTQLEIRLSKFEERIQERIERLEKMML